MSKYKNKWEAYSVNEAFWREVLEGRVIQEVKFDDKGIRGILLDSGELVSVQGGAVSIQDTP